MFKTYFQIFWVFQKLRRFTTLLFNQGISHLYSNNVQTLSTTLHSVAYQLISQNPHSPVQKLMSYISTPLLHYLSFSFYDLSISPSTLNYKAVTKYYDFNLQSGYKPSRMQNGLTTSRGGVCYVSSMIQVGTGRRCRTEHKRAARIKIIMVMCTITLLNYSKVLLPGSLLHV